MITANHFTDSAGNPCGGTTFGNGFAIGWQHGPLGRGTERVKANGAFVEDVITAVIDRLEFYQDSRFVCDENASALYCLREALLHLHKRTNRREQQNTEGTNQGN
jgi:hypothetical protein